MINLTTPICFFPNGRRFTKSKDIIFYFGVAFKQMNLLLVKLNASPMANLSMYEVFYSHPKMKNYDYSNSEKNFNVDVKLDVAGGVFNTDNSIGIPYYIDIDLTKNFEPILDWIFKNVASKWVLYVEDFDFIIRDPVTLKFGFDDLQEATLFRLKF